MPTPKQIMGHFRNHKIEECMRNFDALEDAEKITALNDLNFSALYGDNATAIPYADRWVLYLYFMRLGLAYGFEYSMIYEMILRDMERTHQNRVGVLSFGCGSCIDAWALAYSRQVLNSNVSVEYWGYDKVIWNVSVFDRIENNRAIITGKVKNDDGQWQDKELKIWDFMIHPPFEQDVAGNFEGEKALNDKDFNVLIFPKLLNELNGPTLDNFYKNLSGENGLNIDRGKTYYICASHGRTDADHENNRGPSFIRRIIEGIFEIFEPRGFRVSDDFQTVESLSRYYSLEHAEFEELPNNCFGISSNGTIYDINNEFNFYKPKLNSQNLLEYINTLNEHFANDVAPGNLRSPIINPGLISFQIIKLVPKE